MSDEYIPEWNIERVRAINKLFMVLKKVYALSPELRDEIEEAYKELNVMSDALAPKWEHLNGWKAREELKKLTWEELEPRRREGVSLFKAVSLTFENRETWETEGRSLFASVSASFGEDH